MSGNGSPVELAFIRWAGGEGVFLFIGDFWYLQAIWIAVQKAVTWGDFRRRLPEGEWESLGLQVDLESKFDPAVLPGFYDGRYPPWYRHLAADALPDAFREKYGRQAERPGRGRWVEFPLFRIKEMKKTLRHFGFEVVVVPEEEEFEEDTNEGHEETDA